MSDTVPCQICGHPIKRVACTGWANPNADVMADIRDNHPRDLYGEQDQVTL